MAVSLNPNGLTLGNTTVSDWADAGSTPSGYAVEVTIVGGGGGGAYNGQGAFAGGGGGGVVVHGGVVAYGETVGITVGAGGGGFSNNVAANQGGQSTFRNLNQGRVIAKGGGAGFRNHDACGSLGGQNGSVSGTHGVQVGWGGSMGHIGRFSNGNNANNDSRGGGGAGGQTNSRNPGAGYLCFDGVTRAAGGNGWSNSSGGANTGTGGDGEFGKTGGSGVVIIRYPGNSAVGSGGTVTTSGGYVYHRFNSSGNFNAGNG